MASKTIGRPIWMYANDWRLLRGMKDALEGLIRAKDLGIAYHDVGPYSIILAERGAQGPLGYIVDLDCADFAANVAPDDGKQKSASTSASGTLPFLATEVLAANAVGQHFAQTFDHDAESFAYILSYAVLRRCITLAEKGVMQPEFRDAKNAGAHRLLMTEYKAIFGGASYEVLQRSRGRAGGHFNWPASIANTPAGLSWMRVYGPKESLFDLFATLGEVQMEVIGAHIKAVKKSSKKRLYATAPQETPAIPPFTHPALITFEQVKEHFDTALQTVSQNEPEMLLQEGERPEADEENDEDGETDEDDEDDKDDDEESG
ncbi:unnamed protein product [Peniophora sp. CBMAI 1063]|nr:unnamed protein product [Peniophora sp. CBMAI 1063]